MRSSLLPSLLAHVNPNIRQGFGSFTLFEIGKSHSKSVIGEDDLPEEVHGLSLVIAADEKSAKQEFSGAPFYQAKKFLQSTLGETAFTVRAFGEEESFFVNNLRPLFQEGRSGVVEAKGEVVGVVGEFANSVSRKLKLPEFSAGFEINIATMSQLESSVSGYTPLSRFPSTDQDITLRIATKLQYRDIKETIHELLPDDGGKLLTNLETLDIYVDEKEPDFKNVTFRISLQHLEHTLKTKEVNKIIENIAGHAKKTHGAEQV